VRIQNALSRSLRCLFLPSLLVVAAHATSAGAQESFVNWESPHVHPVDRTPDGTRLLVVNTPDARLEVFDVTGVAPLWILSIPVGLDPVSVRARSDSEAWVVNRVSDSVSVVDLAGGRVAATLRAADEPADVVFAGAPQRAFVTCGGASRVLVFDPADRAAAPVEVEVVGDQPRALAVSLDGSKVYAAVFESGNRSTVLGGGIAEPGDVAFPPNVVDDPGGPYGGQNPPPNSGSAFVPRMNPGNPAPPRVSLIVKQGRAGSLDGRQRRRLDRPRQRPGRPQVRPAGRLGPLRPRRGGDRRRDAVGVVRHRADEPLHGAGGEPRRRTARGGRHRRHERGALRAEPERESSCACSSRSSSRTGASEVLDLNPHLDYSVPSVPPALREQSLGDPRAIVWNAAGSRAYVAGMGSGNLVVLDASGARAGLAPTIGVGEGPTGIALDEARGRLTCSIASSRACRSSASSSEVELGRVSFHDATPLAIREGRPFLYSHPRELRARTRRLRVVPRRRPHGPAGVGPGRIRPAR
jgi:YVTN family beta-propeller protein